MTRIATLLAVVALVTGASLPGETAQAAAPQTFTSSAAGGALA